MGHFLIWTPSFHSNISTAVLPQTCCIFPLQVKETPPPHPKINAVQIHWRQDIPTALRLPPSPSSLFKTLGNPCEWSCSLSTSAFISIPFPSAETKLPCFFPCGKNQQKLYYSCTGCRSHTTAWLQWGSKVNSKFQAGILKLSAPRAFWKQRLRKTLPREAPSSG